MATGHVPQVVDRAMYADAGAEVWAWGINVLATRMRWIRAVRAMRAGPIVAPLPDAHALVGSHVLLLARFDVERLVPRVHVAQRGERADEAG